MDFGIVIDIEDARTNKQNFELFEPQSLRFPSENEIRYNLDSKSQSPKMCRLNLVNRGVDTFYFLKRVSQNKKKVTRR